MNKNLKLEYMDMTKPKTTCVRGADEHRAYGYMDLRGI